MSMRLPRIDSALVTLACLLLIGCQQQDRDELSILWKKGIYKRWLLQQRPYLASLPKSAIVAYDFTTLHSGTNVSPVVTYDLRAGQWDGVVELWFTLRLDPKRKPIGFSEETVTFIRLPSTESGTGKDGKKRNNYYGIKFRQPAEVAKLIKRVAAGGDFADYRKQVDESGEFACSFFDYNDPWKNHKAK
jgi:hypothetical protein